MMNRRKFLMAALAAMPVSCVGWAAAGTRRNDSAAPEGPFPTMPPAEPTGAPTAAVPLFLPTDTQRPPVLLEGPTCTTEAQSPIPRADWGARVPDVRPDGWGENGPYSEANPNGWLEYPQPLSDVYHTIVVHHSALPLSDGPKQIQDLHMDEKGFADVGYHFLIDELGRLFEGRALQARGAHTYAHNYGAAGICMIGNFEVIQPAQPQMEMLQQLIACLLGSLPGIRRIAGHRDLNPGVTLCPGTNLAPFLPQLAAQFGLDYGA